jgi:hypothetical protein
MSCRALTIKEFCNFLICQTSEHPQYILGTALSKNCWYSALYSLWFFVLALLLASSRSKFSLQYL